MKTKTTIWKAEHHLKTKEEREAYLNAAFEDGDASVIAAALGDIARAEGMSKVAKKTGLGRREPVQDALGRWKSRVVYNT